MLIPALKTIIDKSSGNGVDYVIMGMPHRYMGRFFLSSRCSKLTVFGNAICPLQMYTPNTTITRVINLKLSNCSSNLMYIIGHSVSFHRP